MLYGAPRIQHYDEGEIENQQMLDVHTLEEARLAALLYNSLYLHSITRYFNNHMQARSFQVGDLVLRRILNTKLSSPWDGSILVF